jgi:hypothetical protein
MGEPCNVGGMLSFQANLSMYVVSMKSVKPKLYGCRWQWKTPTMTYSIGIKHIITINILIHSKPIKLKVVLCWYETRQRLPDRRLLQF